MDGDRIQDAISQRVVPLVSTGTLMGTANRETQVYIHTQAYIHMYTDMHMYKCVDVCIYIWVTHSGSPIQSS